jgi:Glycosyl transferase family 2/Glycosyl transferases group 1
MTAHIAAAGPPGSAGTVLDSYAALALEVGSARLAAPMLRTRSAAARSILIYLASRGGCSYHQLTEELDRSGSPPTQAMRSRRGRHWLLALASIMAAQNIQPRDRAHATAIFDAAVDRFGRRTLTAEQQAFYAQLLFLSGDFDKAERFVDRSRRLPVAIAEYLGCDLANPFVRPSRSDKEGWLARLNDPITRRGLEPIVLWEGQSSPFDRLSANAHPVPSGGPLVTVIMTSYRPGEPLITAVRSILGQTWTALELVIVDDGSGGEFAEVLGACAALDDRVRLIRRTVNEGTYVSRNVGLASARGDFVTFQDSDDWAHPRRLERQIAPLLAQADVVATHSIAVRAHDDLTHQWLGYPAQRVNASSLLFRREPVLSKIGYFDSVRRSADSEYTFRLEAAFGQRVHRVNDPLSYTRLRHTSLSRSDFAFGWAAPARAAYRSAYAPWHRAIARGADPYLPQHQVQRLFPAPATYLEGHDRPGASQRHYDVILFDDWLPHNAPFEGAVEEIQALQRGGLAVGLLHHEALGRMTRPRKQVDPQIQEAVNSGLADWVLPDEDVSASLLVVRDPWVLQFATSVPTTVHAERVVITIPRPSTGYPRLHVAYDPQSCSDSVRRMFGSQPRWIVTHPGLSQFAPDRDPDGAGPDVVAPPVAIDRWVTRRTPRPDPRPIIGRYDTDADVTWPESRSVLRRAYPLTPDVDVRILGGTDSALKVLRRMTVPPTWLVYRHDEVTLRAFLHQLDFFVYFPSNRLAFPPADLLGRAMASGTVVVLPERFQEYFGEAALYCAPEQLRPILQRYHADPDLYREQAERALRFVQEHHRPSAYVKQIDHLSGRQDSSRLTGRLARDA